MSLDAANDLRAVEVGMIQRSVATKSRVATKPTRNKLYMHPALWQLIWLDIKGSFRGLLNLRRSWKQVFLIAIMIAMASVIVLIRANDSTEAIATRFGPAMPFWALVYLLATWLTASADRGLVMRPAEIHFVVGGPFASHNVITLAILRLAFRAFLSAAIISLLAMAYIASYPSALFGMWLLMMFSLLVGMIGSLLARDSLHPAYKNVQRLLTAIVWTVLVLLVAQSVQIAGARDEPIKVSAVAAAAQQTFIGRWLMPPVVWMFRPLNSTDFWSETLPLVPSRIIVLGSLCTIVYLLGGRFAETVTKRTDRSIWRRKAALRSGVEVKSSWSRKITVASFPRFGGVGAVAWMQFVHSLRILPRYVAFTASIVGVVVVIPVVLDKSNFQGWSLVGWMAGLGMYADFLLLLQLPVGFLGPMAQRELLRALPIANWKIALGQLAGPLLPLMILHGLTALLFLCLVPKQWHLVLGTFLVLIPVALVLAININLLGLWGIIKPRALQQRDALAAGRAMASAWIFFFMLTPAALLTAATIALGLAILGDQVVAVFAGIALGVGLSSLGYFVLLAATFSAWQPLPSEMGDEEREMPS